MIRRYIIYIALLLKLPAKLNRGESDVDEQQQQQQPQQSEEKNR